MDAPVITPVPSAVNVTTDRFFTGAQSLCLNSNSTTPSSSIATPGNQPGQSPVQWSSFQVAVSVNQSTAATPWPAPGTEVAKITWKTRIRTQVAEKPHRKNATYVNKWFDVKFVTNSSTSIDVIVVAPLQAGPEETKIGTLEGGRGDWAMVSLIQGTDTEPIVLEGDDQVTTDTPILHQWIAYDLGNHSAGRFVYIGPQPGMPFNHNEPGFIDPAHQGFYPDLLSGVHIFLNSDAPALSYLPNEIYDGLVEDGAYGSLHGMLMDGYLIAANSGEMDVYVDELWYSVGGHDDPNDGANGISLAQAARMQPFTGIVDPSWPGLNTIETPRLSARGWNIYE
jgi:hypothetical protein